MPLQKERPPFPEFEMAVVKAYTSTFMQRDDCYPLQLEDGTYATVKKPFHINLVTAHLQGRLTLGAYALDENHTARWLCFDADNPDQWAEIQIVAQQLEKHRSLLGKFTARRALLALYAAIRRQAYSVVWKTAFDPLRP